jgi:hypothetical protein
MYLRQREGGRKAPVVTACHSRFESFLVVDQPSIRMEGFA